MHLLLIALVAVPLVPTVACLVAPRRSSQIITIVAAAVAFGLTVALIPYAASHGALSTSILRADAVSVVFLLPTTFLYLTAAIFSVGYLRATDDPRGRRYVRRFYVGFNVFCWSMVVAPLVNGLALLWVAIEVTTVVSALLVAIDDTDGAAEAAWKYVLLASMGLGVALLGTIVMYYAGTKAFGPSYDLSYGRLLAGAPHFSPDAVRLADVLAVLGFGTKMGLVPVHTWLPDAHSEAPTPISALLSGALLTTSFYAIVRFFQISERALGPTFPRTVLLVFGLASLALAALYVLNQRDLKRLLAYSSVEHMGILAIGMSFAAPLALVGVLLHVIAHGAAKGSAFFGAGSVVRKFATKDLRQIRGGVSILPWSGTMLVLAVLALSGLPPFGIFRSEFLIVAGGLRDPNDAVAAILVVLATVAFFGLSWFTTETMLTPVTGTVPPRGEVSVAIVIAMLVGMVALVVLGVHVPGALNHLLERGARSLEVSR